MQDPRASGQSSSACSRTPKRLSSKPAGTGLPPLLNFHGSSNSGPHFRSHGSQTCSRTPPMRRAWSTGDSMRQTWSAGFFPRGHLQQGDGMRLTASKGHGTNSMQKTWSTGFLASAGENTARKTWSSGIPSKTALLSGGGDGRHSRGVAPAAPRCWQQRGISWSVRKGFAAFGLPVWDSLLQVLPLEDAGALAAVSRACSLQLHHDLSLARQQTRQCIMCGNMFNYLTGHGECRYHPGEEKVSLFGDGPTAGMMDVSWTCCGKGAAYAVGIALPCTRSEVSGCCTRNHRAEKRATREAQRDHNA
jgi:hypothetical protein